MRDIILALDRFGDQALLLGRVGENRATRVLIDLKSILSQYPDAIASITVKPPGRTEYPATVKQEGGILTWEITSADIGDKAGSGQAQITLRDADGTIIKTAIATTRVAESLGSPQSPAPDPVKGWVANAEEILADVERSGAAAQKIADEVKHKLDAGELTGAPGRDGIDGNPGKDGAAGATGATPQIKAEAVTGEPGTQVSVTQSGTPENPILSFKIPRGDRGEHGAKGAPGKDAVIDVTLTQEGEAADAATTGKRLAEIEKAVAEKADKARQNILIGSETGNPVSVSDAFSAPLCGLTVYGRSTQDGTPSPDNPVPIVSAGDGGSVAVTLSDGNNKTQTLTLPTPNGLLGIPVTSGGNYTDPTGQQWVCDEINLTRGVRVQRVESYTLQNVIITAISANTYRISYAYEIIEKASGTVYSLLCTTYTNNHKSQWASEKNPISWSGEPYRQLRVYDSRDQAKVLESLNSGNVRIDYVLDDPIETPLTPAELAAYKALTTYAPDTVAQASDGAGVKLEYQCDVNIVIKNLEDAIASMTTT